MKSSMSTVQVRGWSDQTMAEKVYPFLEEVRPSPTWGQLKHWEHLRVRVQKHLAYFRINEWRGGLCLFFYPSSITVLYSIWILILADSWLNFLFFYSGNASTSCNLSSSASFTVAWGPLHSTDSGKSLYAPSEERKTFSTSHKKLKPLEPGCQ